MDVWLILIVLSFIVTSVLLSHPLFVLQPQEQENSQIRGGGAHVKHTFHFHLYDLQDKKIQS